MAVNLPHRSSFKSSLTHAKGLGSAKSGTAHWLEQHYLSVALIPLGLYALVSFYREVLLGGGFDSSVAWLQCPLNALAMILLILAGIRHGANGIQSSIVEDYIHHPVANLAMNLATKFLAVMIAGFGVLAVLKVFLSA